VLKSIPLVAAAIGLASLLVPLAAAPAFAHEERDFNGFHAEVGFGDEPPYIGEKNSVQLILSTKVGKPVTDLGDSLQVEVSTAGNQPMKLALEPNFEVGGDGTPGDYRACSSRPRRASTPSTSPARSRARTSTSPSPARPPASTR